MKPAVEPVVVVPAVEETVVDDSALYVGLGISAVSTRKSSFTFWEDIDSPDKTGLLDRTGEVSLLVGYDFNRYIAIEGRYIFSFTHEDILERSSWGVYVKPQYPVYEDIKVYALLGYGGIEANGIDGSNIDVDETGFQWGIGTSYNMTENISIFVDYLKVANNMNTTFTLPAVDIDSDVITMGAVYKF